MTKFFKKYVNRRIQERLIVSGLKYGELWKYKEGEYLPMPATFYKMIFVIAVELDLNVDDLLFDAVQYIIGDKK